MRLSANHINLYIFGIVRHSALRISGLQIHPGGPVGPASPELDHGENRFSRDIRTFRAFHALESSARIPAVLYF